MPDRALGLLGLGARAGSVIVGTGRIRAALQSTGVRAVVIAADRSARTEAKVERLARAKGVPVVAGPPAETLGRRVGRWSVQAVGVIDQRLADGLVARSRVGGSSDDEDARP